MIKKQNNPEKEIKELEERQEYLKARKEIFDYAISRSVLEYYITNYLARWWCLYRL